MSEMMDMAIALHPPETKDSSQAAVPRTMTLVFFCSCCMLLVGLPTLLLYIRYNIPVIVDATF